MLFNSIQKWLGNICNKKLGSDPSLNLQIDFLILIKIQKVAYMVKIKVKAYLVDMFLHLDELCKNGFVLCIHYLIGCQECRVKLMLNGSVY